MRILLVSPLGYPVNAETKYAGIERLVFAYACELCRLGHTIEVIAHTDSVFPESIVNHSYKPAIGEDIYLQAELTSYQKYQHILRDFDIIHDFSHQHLASRFNPSLPSLNIFWHAPSVAQYPKSPYNIVGLSQWACREFERVYKQKARFMQSIVVDTNLYKLSNLHRTDRFLTLGAMTPRKGNLGAINLCKAMRLNLDVAGKGYGDKYENQVKSLCDGSMIRYLGEVDDAQKIRLMQTCKALIYVAQEPEVTNHKLQEAMLCGAPVVVTAIGAMPEIVTHSVNGYLCTTANEFAQALLKIDRLDIKREYEYVRDTYSIESVVKSYLPLYESVANGERW